MGKRRTEICLGYLLLERMLWKHKCKVPKHQKRVQHVGGKASAAMEPSQHRVVVYLGWSAIAWLIENPTRISLHWWNQQPSGLHTDTLWGFQNCTRSKLQQLGNCSLFCLQNAFHWSIGTTCIKREAMLNLRLSSCHHLEAEMLNSDVLHLVECLIGYTIFKYNFLFINVSKNEFAGQSLYREGWNENVIRTALVSVLLDLSSGKKLPLKQDV